jgi:hypothetical protein
MGGEAALRGGLERLGGDGAAVRVGRVGPGRLCAGLQAMQELFSFSLVTGGVRASP